MTLKSLCMVIALTAGAAVSATAAAADPIGQPAPTFSLPLRGGNAPLGLDKLRGQVIMVNFWASWCEPCRKEFPLLDQIYKKYKGVGFTLVGVNVEPDAKDAEKLHRQDAGEFPDRVRQGQCGQQAVPRLRHADDGADRPQGRAALGAPQLRPG